MLLITLTCSGSTAPLKFKKQRSIDGIFNMIVVGKRLGKCMLGYKSSVWCFGIRHE